MLFIFFQIVIIISFSSIYFIPDNPSIVPIELACDDTGLLETCNVTTATTGYQAENSTCDVSIMCKVVYINIITICVRDFIRVEQNKETKFIILIIII